MLFNNNMIYLEKGKTNNIILTLSEKAQLYSPNYLFVFTSRVTNNVIKFIILGTADLSIDKTRFNSFNIITNNYFSNELKGEWAYTIYEQASTTNLNIKYTTSLIEEGQMILSDTSSTFNFNTYVNQSNNFIVRNI